MKRTKLFLSLLSYGLRLAILACFVSQAFMIAPIRAGQAKSPRAASSGIFGDCPVFPANNFWNTQVDQLPVHARSDQWVNTIGRSTGFHMDFGSGTWAGGPIGIPYNVVGSGVPKVPVSFYYEDESDPGPYPIPTSPRIEHGSDHHILIVDTSTCTLYELFDASRTNGAWSAGSGAIWDLNSNALRPDTWTSADAAGLPILPGLVRYEEILSGEIRHALRFTASNTNRYIWPARHLTLDNPNALHIPPMGARFRLKASYDISGHPPEMQIILRAMKTYGIVLADNGSNWYVSGAPDPRWDNDMLHLLDDLTGNDFEAVDTSMLKIDDDSAAAGYLISGNAGKANVRLSYMDGVSRTVTSQANGSYSLAVRSGWSGTVTPSHPCFDFTPGNRSYNLVAANQTGQNYVPAPSGACTEVISRSAGVNDGWIRESTETSILGGTMNNISLNLRLGDDAANRQYRSILSFHTSALPDDAMITSVTLKFKQSGISGTNPFTTHGSLLVDVRKGTFSSNPALQLSDFKDPASRKKVLIYTNMPVESWYSGSFQPADFPYINLTGVTQFRLRFALDDNNDLGADFLKIHSGNADPADQPQLIVEYYVP